MAAYASLVSLRNLIDQIQNHPHPPITLPRGQVEPLCQQITYLQEFLEVYSHGAIEEAAKGFAQWIATAAYAAADVIEFYIAEQICNGSTNEIEDFYGDLQKVILHLFFITKEVMGIKDKVGNQEHQLLHRHLTSDGSKRLLPPSAGLKNDMVGFDNVFDDVLDKLTGCQSSRLIIPIVGMGGIGKTTLVSNAYENQLVVQHFDVRSWVIVSQYYNVRDILIKVLLDQNIKENRELLSRMSEEEIGNKVYKSLYDRRYLVVMDDIWSIEAWNTINHFFPDNNNKSRIMMTTRNAFVASKLSKEKIKIDFLDEEKSWELLCNIIIGEEAYPVELEESGRKIAKDCKGLPLSITVMGGLLAKSRQTQEDWMFIAEKLNLNMSLKHEEHCLQILQTSFDHLPVHLKPCFLYIGVFPEDNEIKASNLIKLWAAEGFVKPICGKSLEFAAEEYLVDLIDRNLVLVKVIGSTGKIKVCSIHDLMRDLCIKEAQKQRFLCVARKQNLGIEQGIAIQRRISIQRSALMNEHHRQVLDALQSASLVHSMICAAEVFRQLPSRMLRILYLTGYIYMDPRTIKCFFNDILQSINLRFLALNPILSPNFQFPSSICHLWNLQIIIADSNFFAPFEIWKMNQLEHVKVHRLYLPDPLPGADDHKLVLENLQTLATIVNFEFSEEVVKMIPNIRKLKIIYSNSFEECSQYHLTNLGRLRKLESLYCNFKSSSRPSRSDSLPNITFPHSLIKMELIYIPLHWEHVITEIGSLPHLQVLKLASGIQGFEWNLVEGKFRHLKSLVIQRTGLTYWTAENNHFPCLERLSLKSLRWLEEIPLDIGDAPKLQSIELHCCKDSVVNSAQRILDEQEQLGNAGLKVSVWKHSAACFVELRPNIEDEEDPEE